MKTYSIDNGNLRAFFLSYGAILRELWVKDNKGLERNVIQGLPKAEDYLNDEWSRGAVIGRFAGRLENPILIEGERVSIEHQKGVLLHSGPKGWNKQEWEIEGSPETDRICFSYTCPKGTAGFPGTVKAKIIYQLKGNRLCINYHATTDAPTHINLTNHAYFNLASELPINHHELKINADKKLELKENLVPKGTMMNVNNTAFDFINSKEIKNIRMDDYFVLNETDQPAATLYSPISGIEMTTYTDQPGMVVFTPPHFDGICFETQKFSNTPNVPSFPSTLVRPEENYSQSTHYVFTLKNED